MRLSCYAAIFVLTLVVSGCGSDTGEGGAPAGGSIVFSPTSISVNMSGDSTAVNTTSPLLVTVLNSAGNPVQGAKVDLFFDGVLLDEALSTQAQPYKVTTDDHGNIRFFILYPIGGGLDYLVTAQAFSGGAYNNMELTVTCTDTDDTTDACD